MYRTILLTLVWVLLVAFAWVPLAGLPCAIGALAIGVWFVTRAACTKKTFPVKLCCIILLSYSVFSLIMSAALSLPKLEVAFVSREALVSKVERIQTIQRMRLLRRSCLDYAAQHQGILPSSTALLVSQRYCSTALTISPQGHPYRIMVPDISTNEAATKRLPLIGIWSNSNDLCTVLFLDNTISLCTGVAPSTSETGTARTPIIGD